MTLFRQLLVTRMVYVSDGITDLEARVGPGGCSEPPYSERQGVFRGRYASGFEESAFRPCPDSALGIGEQLLPGRRPLRRPSAWAEFPSIKNPWIQWPAEAVADEWGTTTVFVVWRGTLKGPGMFGHLGVSEFEFSVDSILTVRVAAPDDCLAPTEPVSGPTRP